jgi:hypothetical protein
MMVRVALPGSFQSNTLSCKAEVIDPPCIARHAVPKPPAAPPLAATSSRRLPVARLPATSSHRLHVAPLRSPSGKGGHLFQHLPCPACVSIVQTCTACKAPGWFSQPRHSAPEGQHARMHSSCKHAHDPSLDNYKSSTHAPVLISSISQHTTPSASAGSSPRINLQACSAAGDKAPCTATVRKAVSDRRPSVGRPGVGRPQALTPPRAEALSLSRPAVSTCSGLSPKGRQAVTLQGVTPHEKGGRE